MDTYEAWVDGSLGSQGQQGLLSNFKIIQRYTVRACFKTRASKQKTDNKKHERIRLNTVMGYMDICFIQVLCLGAPFIICKC